MIVLRDIEADVLELLRKGESQRRIAATLNVNRGTVINAIARLSELSAIEDVSHGKYRVVIDKYERTNCKHGGVKRGASAKVDIPEDVAFYIRGHYKKIPRRELAARLKVDKVTLNLMILQLGLGE